MREILPHIKEVYYQIISSVSMCFFYITHNQTRIKNCRKTSFAGDLKGYILVESIVAITILLIGLMGIFSLLSQSLGLNRVVGDRYVATYLSAEGIEIVKNIIDTNVVRGRPYNAGFSSGVFEVEHDDGVLVPSENRRMKFDSDRGLYNYLVGKDTRFYREIKITLVGSEEVKVNSIVSWTTRGGGGFNVNLEDHFFNWR